MTNLQKQALKNVAKNGAVTVGSVLYILLSIYLATTQSPWFWLNIVIPIASLLLYVAYDLELSNLEREERMKLAEQARQRRDIL
jgi:uncharacterized membrane protein YwzB